MKKFKIKNGIKISRLDNSFARNWKANGIDEGCIITAINDEKVNTVEDAQRIIDNKEFNEPLKFEIINKYGEKENYYWR